MSLAPDWLVSMDTGALFAINLNIETVIEAQLVAFGLKTGQAVYRTCSSEGKMDITHHEVHEFLATLGGRLSYRTLLPLDKNGAPNDGRNRSIYILDSGYIGASLYDKNSSFNCVNYHGMDPVMAAKLRDFMSKHHVEESSKGRVYVIVQTSAGLEVRNIGVAGVEFEEGNYEEDVAQAYQHVIDDFNSSDPCGRLVLLDGPPGTGKTYMVRSLLSACPNLTFVLIPPQMVSELSGPSLVTCLTGIREKSGRNHAVVLVIEDGERVLLPRGNDNDVSVSSMLNTCDGIFGTILDLRVLVTTNEKNEKVDKALKRSGRLCRSIHIGELSPKRASAVFKRLTGETPDLYPSDRDGRAHKTVPLCDVYRLARDRGWKAPEDSKDRPLGFRLEPFGDPVMVKIGVETEPGLDWDTDPL